MADIADRAGEHIEREAAGLLAQRKPAGPAATGSCHNCGEALEGDSRWCDADCRADWEREQRRALNKPLDE